MHERLAADDAEEDVAHLLGLAHQLVEGVGLDGFLLGGDVHPAALAAQVAAVDDRDVEERREVFAALEAALVLLHGQHALPAHVPGQLPQEALVRFDQHSPGHFQQVHDLPFVSQFAGIEKINCYGCFFSSTGANGSPISSKRSLPAAFRCGTTW